MGGKPRKRAPINPLKRSNKTKVIWTGQLEGSKARITAVDKDSTRPEQPCLLVLEKQTRNSLGKLLWTEHKGLTAALNNLECTLVLEIAKLSRTLPDWASDVAHTVRKKAKAEAEAAEREKIRRAARERNEARDRFNPERVGKAPGL